MSKPTPEPGEMTCGEAAAALGLNYRTIHRYADKGRLRSRTAQHKGRSYRFYSRADVEALASVRAQIAALEASVSQQEPIQ